MASTLWQSTAADDDREPPAVDTSVAHIARVYDYWLGGKNHFAADREAGDEAVRAYPDMYMSVRQNRAFLQRAVRYLAGAGIRQFLDIGTGLPSSDNTHEVAQSIAPESRVVYVDNDRCNSGCTHARKASMQDAGQPARLAAASWAKCRLARRYSSHHSAWLLRCRAAGTRGGKRVRRLGRVRRAV